MVDTLRADYLGTYGFQGNISPNIDAFAKKSLVFDRAITQAPWTKPSISSLFSGVNVVTHDLVQFVAERDSDGKLSEVYSLGNAGVTLAEAFKSNNYLAVGSTDNVFVSNAFGLTRGFDSFQEARKWETDFNKSRGQRIYNEAKNWLTLDKKRSPFFLYLHFMDVHGPYTFDKDDFYELRGSKSLGSDSVLKESQIQKGLIEFPDWVKQEDRYRVNTYRAAYAAGIKKFDRLFGSLIKFLEEEGYLENSIVVVTSDHGEELMEYGRWDHGFSFYEILLQVPLLIYHPNFTMRNARTEHLVGLIDLFPTLMSLIGNKKSYEHLQGHDFSSIITGGQYQPQEDLLTSGLRGEANRNKFAYRTKNTKLLLNVDDANQDSFFDLEKDPREYSPRKSGYDKTMRKKATEKIRKLPTQAEFKKGRGVVSQDQINNLRSLGYLK